MSAVVVRSIESSGGQRCVDIFRRPDGTFGFDEWRRDPEDASGWHRVGHFGHAEFVSEEEALARARTRVGWLGQVIDGDR